MINHHFPPAAMVVVCALKGSQSCVYCRAWKNFEILTRAFYLELRVHKPCF